MLDRIFNRWTKWKIVRENEMRTKTVTNVLLGGLLEKSIVYVDVFRKENKYNGKVKYKFIER